MLIPMLRNSVLFNKIKTPVIPSNSIATQFFAAFHKGKNKFTVNVKGGQGKTPSKNQIRLATRQRRADAKKALEDFLHRSGSSRFSFLEEEESRWKWKVGLADNLYNLHEKGRPKSSARRPKKSHRKKNKCKSRRDSFYESFDDYPEMAFNSRYESFFRKAESGWREHLNSKHKSKTWGSSSDSESESEDESYTVRSCANRTLLGLPPSGPLKIEDIKKAFHLSALKWHPDKHQGPTQAVAEDKFKLCVDAYKSLCNLISTA